MINTSKQTPSVYSRESRDYQLISKLFDSSFNVSKNAIDSMLNLSSDRIDSRFVDLACKTLGFDYHRSYTYNELLAVVRSFKSIIANKGTIKAIEDSVKLLLNSQGITEKFNITATDHKIEILVPVKTKNTSLLEELFNYILPAGWIYEIIMSGVDPRESAMQLATTDKIRKKDVADLVLGSTNYISKDGELEDTKYIGQVPKNTEDKFVSPTVNFDTTISDKSQNKHIDKE